MILRFLSSFQLIFHAIDGCCGLEGFCTPFRTFAPVPNSENVTHGLVISHLDYYNALCMEMPLKSIWELQLVQIVATWVEKSVGYSTHITVLLCELNWLPVCFWI